MEYVVYELSFVPLANKHAQGPNILFRGYPLTLNNLYFEGVCETHAILTHGVCGSGAPTALADTTSPGPAESDCEFQEAHLCLYLH